MGQGVLVARIFFTEAISLLMGRSGVDPAYPSRLDTSAPSASTPPPQMCSSSLEGGGGYGCGCQGVCVVW